MLGLGLLGRGLNDAIFLAECGADLIITDLKTEDQLKSSLNKLKKYKNIKYVLGGHQIEDFRNRDFILKSAGVPLHSIYIEEARKNNIPVRMDASWFAELSPETKVIGVTGTRGKSTVTHLIYQILKAAKDKGIKGNIYLGGNIKGLATLPLLKKIQGYDHPVQQTGHPSLEKEGISGKPPAAVVVMELDSWQLQGFGDTKISPNISVFTNLMSDHLNYYLKGSQDEKEAEERYFMDKAQIYLNQKAGDYLICGEKIASRIGKINSQKIIAKKGSVPKAWKIKIPGDHNLENIACAMAVAEVLKIDEKIIKKAVEGFMAVEGRLQLIREYKGIKIYNDTNATTPDATMMALRALGGKNKKIVLIMGGADKSLDMSALVQEIPRCCKKVFLLDGTGSAKLNIEAVIKCGDLKSAVLGAIKAGKKGDSLLFSPAFASFGMFKNEYDRGDKFMKLIKALK